MQSHHFILDPSAISGGGSVAISGQDAKHISKVLRLRAGDIINVSDGVRYVYQVELEVVGGQQVAGNVIETTTFVVPERRLTVFQGLPKGRKMDLVVEKLIEIGVARIVPVALARSVPEYGFDKGVKRHERWRAIAYEACKQSRRLWLPEINGVVSFDEALAMLGAYDEVLVPFEDCQGKRLGDVYTGAGLSVAVIIGPEGGFEASEIAGLEERGAKMFSLGDNILRTETAAIVASALILEKMNK